MTVSLHFSAPSARSLVYCFFFWIIVAYFCQIVVTPIPSKTASIVSHTFALVSLSHLRLPLSRSHVLAI